MAHHHQGRYGQVHGLHDVQLAATHNPASALADDEPPPEADEPPDDIGTFTSSRRSFAKVLPLLFERKRSLLTEALAPVAHPLDSKELASTATRDLGPGRSRSSSTCEVSGGSTVDLTSDGEITSPARTNTPSPPPPQMGYAMSLHALDKLSAMHEPDLMLAEPALATLIAVQEAAPVRKPCIRFACTLPGGGKPVTKKIEPALPEAPVKRPCALRFACPFKATGPAEASENTPRLKPAISSAGPPSKPAEPEATINAAEATPIAMAAFKDRDGDLRHSEATRFHEFASSVDEEDDWIKQKPGHRKLTVNDTLGKEREIRRLAEEVEEEDQIAQDDDEDHASEAADDEEDADAFDDGNESDDEGGFAESDAESDTSSDDLFWVTGPSAAAAAIDQADHGRRRLTRKSSLDSIPDLASPRDGSTQPISIRRNARARRTHKARGHTPPLPDSTDFVCGTLDEDRPLEDAYASCLEQRKRSAHAVIPQDIDPSFPTSDLDDDEDGDDPDDAAAGAARNEPSDGPLGHRGKSPLPSPKKRLRSPPPPPRRAVARSPPRVPLAPTTFSQLAPAAISDDRVHLFLPAIPRRPGISRTKSLPRTPNPFFSQPAPHIGATATTTAMAVATSSRPSSPARRAAAAGKRYVPHRRGAIDIVSGLEHKRQRRREKALVKYCQRAAAKELRKSMLAVHAVDPDTDVDGGLGLGGMVPPPGVGQGAEKMRELWMGRMGRGGGAGGVGGCKTKYVLSC
ncbi:MAG: hypothetical protein M1826_003665 [Phylliscum demangeonii]|nr:MAG: hypothetical protein M1826_003665 [Phylliscum demangeonii]